ncbi:MAG: hypothetical protein ACODAF_06760, partial [Actinomycetota bacterium]
MSSRTRRAGRCSGSTTAGRSARSDPRPGGSRVAPGLAELSARLGVAIDPGLLERALTHRSYAYEHGGLPTNE